LKPLKNSRAVEQPQLKTESALVQAAVPGIAAGRSDDGLRLFHGRNSCESIAAVLDGDSLRDDK
jgi:hypothetical protein